MSKGVVSPDRLQKLLAGLRSAFVAELPERLNHIEEQVLACQNAGSRAAAFDELFRTVHSLKGSGGTHGLAIVTSVCHYFEDGLREWHDRLSELSPGTIDEWLHRVDLLRRTADLIAAGSNDFSAIESGLNAPSTSSAVQVRRGLIVMSSPTQIAMCRGALEGLPVSLAVEENGLDALKRLLHERFDFVVTGNALPGLNGLAMLAAFRLSEASGRQLLTILVANNAGLHPPQGIAIDHVLTRDASFPARLRGLLEALMSRV